jgi:hypothetical protein
MGFLGLAPLLIAGLVALSRHQGTAHVGAVAFVIYAAVLLSFLGGIRCGLELARAPDQPDALRLMFSALPALSGWALAAVMLIYPAMLAASSIFAGLFAAQLVWDQRSADVGAPAWYPLLRQVLTGGVMIACLLLPLASALRRF